MSLRRVWRSDMTQHQFNAREIDWGFTSFMPLGELYDPSRGYLGNDTFVVEAVVEASPAVDRTLRRISAAEDLLKSTSAREPSVEALAALDTVSRYARSSLDTLCMNGAYEEFKAALKLLTEQGMIPSTITSMFKDLLSSL
ncbi:hypothetical protein DVH24_005194 [Malus domestica]|uniref:MATH domain-containing protein n=1 Tax=Malus domestica TaxID=3750 RepID=A0A498IDN1_MALDO|nr:hypothetical protein DVH24_005194 [Malus domestica]